MPPKDKNELEQLKDERREQILIAALKIMSKSGLKATKIGDIAKSAGVSHGLIYHYFQSKEEIFVELIRRATSDSNRVFKYMEELPHEPIEKIEKTLNIILDVIDHDEESSFYFLIMIQASISDSTPEGAWEHIRQSPIDTDAIMRVIKDGQEKGQISEGDPWEYTILLLSTIEGLALHKFFMGEHFKVPNVKMIMRIFEV